MKTVLMICPFAKPNVGGVESHLDKLTGSIAGRGQRVVLVTYQPLTSTARGPRYEKNGNIEIYRAAWFGTGWFPKLEPYFPLVFLYLFPGLLIKSFLVCAGRRKEIDVIHAHGFAAAAVAKVLLLFFKRRSVISTHAIYNFKERGLLASIIKWLLKGFDSVLAVGEPSRQELVGIGLESAKVEVHPNWVDTEHFKPMDRAACKKALGFGPDDFVVLYLGRLIEMKGIVVLLEAARLTDRDIKFAFVGEGPLLGRLKEAAGTDDRLRCLGRLGDDEIITAYNAADLFASPVLYEEGFATVYLEALACGTPVLTAKRGCLPYFLSPEVADMLESVDAESVMKSLEQHYDNRSGIEEKRRVCRKYALENFSEKNAEIIIRNY
ncbi:MAG: glycosyltransferase family 4 protein [Proteobacteria bacterium]|nr:glycosyltransferase family 4 protein [Pseudomonadota bacterium]